MTLTSLFSRPTAGHSNTASAAHSSGDRRVHIRGYSRSSARTCDRGFGRRSAGHRGRNRESICAPGPRLDPGRGLDLDYGRGRPHPVARLAPRPKPIRPLPVQHQLTIFVNDSWFLPFEPGPIPCTLFFATVQVLAFIFLVNKNPMLQQVFPCSQ